MKRLLDEQAVCLNRLLDVWAYSSGEWAGKQRFGKYSLKVIVKAEGGVGLRSPRE